MAVIYAFGDSITYGAWDVKDSGWAARMRRHLDDLQAKDSDLYYLLYNLGIPGETTEGLLKRFKAETEARDREGEDAVFLFAFGANDCAFTKSENGFKVSKEDFTKNLEAVLDQAALLSSKIAVINITPVLEDVYNKTEKGKARFNKDIQEYNAALSELARRKNVLLIDVNSIYIKAGPEKLFCEDGLHPNEEGHRLIFEAVKPVLTDLIN